ncbi:carbohydrate kinase [Actinotalea sp. M2MS4P-6]|uniref:carbohydrate kinase family protein n=1 Tax=Actinotalea sp. M2MS4P-6 TaxID=2983762 RepID=UPI0021E3840E|nr:carbohydrate kinase [Actinotalea sp. M2MS4P-6]MCV2396398.1 carbohydrate kinase [Actinotalea sp. M2MS4P-6]
MSEPVATTDHPEREYDPLAERTPESTVEEKERRALVVGESLIDVVHRADGDVREHAGGSPMNVAIGLARLGRGVDLLTWFGKDERGTMIAEHLAASGVAVVPGSDGAERTPVAIATIGPDGAASYEFDVSYEIPSTWTAPPAAPLVVHTGSIATAIEPGSHDIPHILSAHRPTATITYDPNLRPSLMPPPEETRPLVEHLVGLADVVKVSDEDLAWLVSGSEPLDTAAAWLELGPSAVVVTQGGSGAVALTATGLRVEVSAPRVQVADTVGAGDSFMGGLIDGLWSAGLLGGDRRTALHAADADVWRAVLDRCVRIAAITVSRAGANPPTAAELDQP